MEMDVQLHAELRSFIHAKEPQTSASLQRAKKFTNAGMKNLNPSTVNNAIMEM